MLGLHHHQNALQQQQNKIVEMLATQQKKSNLPQQRVPIFDGDPMEYVAFVRAFENIIEFKTLSSSERLYYRIVTAYETQALNWPEVRAEESISLDRFSIFLMRSKTAMECSKYLPKLEQPDTIQKLVMKLPFNLRKTWCRLVDHIMETERRSVSFSDLAEFVDNEARVTANPVSEKSLKTQRPRMNGRTSRTDLVELKQVLLCKWTMFRVHLLKRHSLDQLLSLRTSHVPSAILVTS